jgi:phosphatidate cytidylyltransferase
MHLKRWLTSIIALPVLIYIIGPGPRWLFQAFIFLASIVALLEFLSITVPKLPITIRLIALLLTCLLFYLISRGPFFMILAAISAWVIVPLSIYLFAYASRRTRAIEEIGRIALGLLYICLPLSLLVFIDKRQDGNIWIFFLLTSAFLCRSSFLLTSVRTAISGYSFFSLRFF